MIFGRKRPAAPWCALFVQSVSPGAVIHFLERRRAALAQQEDPNRLAVFGPGLVLGEAAHGAEPWRALVAVGATCDAPDGAWMEKTGAALAAAFAPSITLLFADDEWGKWGWRIWAREADGAARETEREQGEPPPVPTVLQRLVGLAAPQSATALAVAWAGERGLPAGGNPAFLAGGGKSPPLVLYETVAGLDARGLLREDGPRWYAANGPSSSQPPTV